MWLDAPVRRRARLGLTPLIDVVFILLLFFMLTTRFGQQQAMQLRIDGRASAAVPLPPQGVILRLSDTGSIEMPDGSLLTPDRLGTRSELIRAAEQAAPIALDVDDRVSLQTLVSVLDKLDAVGLSDVSVRGLR